MTSKEKTDSIKWVKCWEKAGKKLAKLHREKIKNCDTSFAIQALEDSFNSAIRNKNGKLFSGLVKQQQLFNKLRK